MIPLRRVPATTLDDAQTIRYIRNVCKDGFSQFNAKISRSTQVKFWERTEGKRRAWLYVTSVGGNPESPVGFGLLLLQDDGLWTTTVAVLPEHAGKGYGKHITSDIVSLSPGPCRAQARKDNPAAVKLHVSELWDVVEGPDERLVYFRTKAGVPA